jgi:hypothetical protein
MKFLENFSAHHIRIREIGFQMDRITILKIKLLKTIGN